jgi:hypothetical protein
MTKRKGRSRPNHIILHGGLAFAVVASAATLLAQPAFADHRDRGDWWQYQQGQHSDGDRYGREWRQDRHWDHGRYYPRYDYGPRGYYYPQPNYYYEPAPSFSFGFSVPVQ